MLRSLAELEPLVRERYQVYQAGIADSTIRPPNQRHIANAKEKKVAPTPTKTVPILPTSIESDMAPRSEPTPGAETSRSESQEPSRTTQVEKQRHQREYALRATGRAHSIQTISADTTAITGQGICSVTKYCRAVSRAVEKSKEAPLVLRHAVETVALICHQLKKHPTSCGDPRLPNLLHDSLSILLALSGRIGYLRSRPEEIDGSPLEDVYELKL